MAKQMATPEVVTETTAPEVETGFAPPEYETTAPIGMTKDVTVYVVKTDKASINFPTKAKSKAAHEALQMFGIASTIETVKKKIAI